MRKKGRGRKVGKGKAKQGRKGRGKGKGNQVSCNYIHPRKKSINQWVIIVEQ